MDGFVCPWFSPLLRWQSEGFGEWERARGPCCDFEEGTPALVMVESSVAKGYLLAGAVRWGDEGDVILTDVVYLLCRMYAVGRAELGEVTICSQGRYWFAVNTDPPGLIPCPSNQTYPLIKVQEWENLWLSRVLKYSATPSLPIFLVERKAASPKLGQADPSGEIP